MQIYRDFWPHLIHLAAQLESWTGRLDVFLGGRGVDGNCLWTVANRSKTKYNWWGALVGENSCKNGNYPNSQTSPNKVQKEDCGANEKKNVLQDIKSAVLRTCLFITPIRKELALQVWRTWRTNKFFLVLHPFIICSTCIDKVSHFIFESAFFLFVLFTRIGQLHCI